MIINQEIKVLMGLGLTSCQARVYLALCHFGGLEAKKISNYASIARQDVYRITADLESLGLIEKCISRPTIFCALPIEKGVSFLLKQRRKELGTMELKTKSLLKKFEPSNTELVTEKAEFVLVPGKETLSEKNRNSLENCQQTMCSVSSYKRFSKIFLFSEAIEGAWSRDVKCRFIMDKPEESIATKKVLKFLTKSPCCEVRFISSIPKTMMTIYDQREIFIISNPNAPISESPALWSNNSSLISGMQDYFTILWVTTQEKLDCSISGGQLSCLPLILWGVDDMVENIPQLLQKRKS